MAELEPTAPSTDAGAIATRIAQLGDAIIVLRDNRRFDAALEVERERDALKQRLAELGGPPPEPTFADAVGLLVVIRDALTMPAPSKRGESAYRAVLAERVEWTRKVLEAVLMGRHDMAFAASFLAAQVARLQPDSVARQERHAAG